MSEYDAIYEDRFVQNLRRCAGLRKQIKRCVEKGVTRRMRIPSF